ncbi:MAG TPA: methyltransferase domain-containing protein [Candidatus Limnocylindria bacterium]|nr:methyltransferase domain-containing protein [Candidatus Limnocylindria bacterium]
MTDASADRLADRDYLRFQYGDDERLRIRVETHQRYSENPVPFRDWLLAHVDARAGQSLLDVGAGPGDYHDALAHARVFAIDTSPGMLAKVKVPRAQADAQALPFRDAAFDRVMANHMLYHVPDRECALREMRRVSRDGGRVVIASNSRHSMAPLFALTNTIERELGLAPEGTVGLRFSIEDTELVRGIFPRARVEVYEDAFIFREVEPLLRYVATQSIGLRSPEVTAVFLERLSQRVRAVIDREGVFRVPKLSGCFVADL